MKDPQRAADPETYRIVEIRGENVKRLSAIQLRPSPDGLVMITGKNGAGKSSLFDLIQWALEGKRAMPSEPIKRGADKAVAEIDLGEILITRRIDRREEDRGGGIETGVTVLAKDGTRVSSPQGVLDRLFGAFTFDPAEFLRMKPADQVERLKSLVPNVDFARLAADHERDYRDRTDVGRERDRLNGAVRGIVVPDDTPDDEVDAAALRSRRQEAERHNETIVNRSARREQAAREIEAKQDAAERLRAQADSLDRDAETLAAQLKAAGDLPVPIDVDEIVEELGRVIETNAHVRMKKDRERIANEAAEKAAEYERLTKQIDTRKSAKLAAIANAKIPVKGVTFGEADEIMLGGVPFEQASTAEQLRAALALGMAMNPKLRAIFIREGSMFDEDSLEVVQAVARERGYQVWIEKVAEGAGEVGFYIEDGALAAVDGKPQERPRAKAETSKGAKR